MWSTWIGSSCSASDDSLHVLPSHVVEQLCSGINNIASSYNSVVESSLAGSAGSGRQFRKLSYHNRLVEEQFRKVMMDVFLGALPKALHHYPDSFVVSCDMKILFAGSICSAEQLSWDSHLCGKDRLESTRLRRDRVDFLEALVDSAAFVHLLQRNGLALHCISATYSSGSTR